MQRPCISFLGTCRQFVRPSSLSSTSSFISFVNANKRFTNPSRCDASFSSTESAIKHASGSCICRCRLFDRSSMSFDRFVSGCISPRKFVSFYFLWPSVETSFFCLTQRPAHDHPFHFPQEGFYEYCP